MRILLIVVVVLGSLGGEARSERPFGLNKRIPWTTSKVVGTPDPPPPYTVQRAFPNLKFKSPVFIAQEPGTERFLVAELSGKIYAFSKDTPNTESRELFLDIGREIYAFSFHPRYEKNGYVFTFSAKDPNDKAKPENRKSRVSRFQAKGSPRRAERKSERIIVEWLSGGHNGGEAIIGPDGYLYVATGDSTSGSDPKGTGQGVNDLFSVIMRLDVDSPAKGKGYSIPKDNPFVDYPGARPEIWAFGFRNPWRMSFDAKTKRLWVGDVGQDLWEMIWIVQKGGNYGWSVQEGSHPFHPNKPRGPGPILPPLVEHHHSVCRSITGGYVYYGSKFPELQGVYFYGDYEYGMIWGVRAKGLQATWNQVLANTPLRIASFGVSRAGDILLLDHPSGEVYELARAPTRKSNRQFPRRLSETGLFSDVRQHQVAAGVIPYSVNAPQWVDQGIKQRFVAVPGAKKVSFVEQSGDARTWGFPDGAVNLETISLEMQAGNPASRRRIETRIIVKQENHWLGYSYLWNDDQTDAVLVGARGRDLRLTIRDPSAPGGKRQQTWHVPSRNECMVCHSRAAGFVLGLRTPQMNRDHVYGKTTDNQLRTLNHIGLFDKPLKKKPAEYDAFSDPYDESADTDARARAYLHVNCSVCHVSDGGGNARIQLKYFQSLEDTRLTDSTMHGTFGLTDARIVVPGDPFASVLFYRLSKWGRGRMPHVGSNVHDDRGIEMIHKWIADLPADKTGARKANRLKREQVESFLDKAEQMPANLRRTQISKFISTTRGALMLAHLMNRSHLVKTRQQAIRLGSAHPDPHVRDLFERYLPPSQRTRRLGNQFEFSTVLEKKGDVERGRRFFLTATSAQCKNCHRVGRQGSELGPDLSDVGKRLKPIEILESLAYPARKIDPKYVTRLLVTSKGKVYTGIVGKQSADAVDLRVFKSGKMETLRFRSNEVDKLVVQKKSMMPDGLLRDMTAQQAADLLAFLVSLKRKH